MSSQYGREGGGGSIHRALEPRRGCARAPPARQPAPRREQASTTTLKISVVVETGERAPRRPGTRRVRLVRGGGRGVSD